MKYNILILSCILLYLGIAAFLGWSILQMEETMDHAYRVEINRILQQVEKGTKAEDIARNSYPHIEKLQWLSAEEGSRETASAFFQEHPSTESKS